MNIDRQRDILIEAIILNHYAGLVGTNERHFREFKIQCSKLQRMLTSNMKSGPNALEGLSGGPSLQEKKRRGKAHAATGEQYRKVKDLFVVFMAEVFRAKSNKPLTNKFIRESLKLMEGVFADAAQRMIAKATNILGEPPAGTPPRPFSRIGARPRLRG
jgi:hypothetical protein